MMRNASPQLLLGRILFLCVVLGLSVLLSVFFFLRNTNDGQSILTGALGCCVAMCIFLFLVLMLLCLTLARLFQDLESQRLLNDSSAVLAHDATLRAEQLSMLTHHLMRVSENEKSALAHDLHGGLASCFTVLTMDMSVIAAKIALADPQLADRIHRIIETVRDAIDLKRRIVEELRPSMLDSLGLPFVLEAYAKEFAHNAGLFLRMEINSDLDQLQPDCAIALFRIAQEALRNIVKHASATTIFLSFDADASDIILCIGDDGVGIKIDVMEKVSSFGLIEMRERASQLLGSFSIRQGEGLLSTQIKIQVPIILARRQ